MKVQVPPSAPSPKPRAQRGATFVAITAVWAHWFKATHPHGVRRITSAAGFYGNWFQSTHPHGVRPEYSETEYSDTEFQSTHPHGVRHLPSRSSPMSLSFQSTHPHGVRHPEFNYNFHVANVSIHAPSRGATPSPNNKHNTINVSIHAPSRGATGPPTVIINHTVGFNPRTLTGCDDGIIFFRGKVDSFQSTHPHGVRPVSTSDVLMPWKFQSTHPHGVRLCSIIGTIRLKNVSIHAPSRGATNCNFCY